MLQTGDIKIDYQKETWGRDAMGVTIPVWEIGFTVRGKIQATVQIARSDYTADRVIQLVTAKAEELCKTLDAFS